MSQWYRSVSSSQSDSAHGPIPYLHWHLSPVPPFSLWACCCRLPGLHPEAPRPLQICSQCLWTARSQAREGCPGQQNLPLYKIFSSWSNPACDKNRAKCTFKILEQVTIHNLFGFLSLHCSYYSVATSGRRAQKAMWNRSHLPHYDCQYQ